MNVAELLKTTPRGSLKYDRSPPSKEFLDKCSSIPELPRFCSETVKKEVIEKSEENVKDNQQEKETCKNESPQRNLPQPKNHTKLVVSPEFGRSVQAIKNYEQILEERAKNKKLEKEKEFKIHSKKLEEEALRKMKEVEQRKIIQAKNTHEKVVRQHQQGMVEMQEKVNKLKEDHRQHKEMIEKRKAKLQEELRQKERERSERMDAIQKLLTEMVNVLQKLSAMYQGCQHKDKLPDKAKQAIDLVQHRVSQGQQLMSQTLKTNDITAEVVDKLKEHLRICSNAFDFVKGQIAEVNKTAEAEAKAKAEAEAQAKAQAEEQAKAKAAAEEAKRAQQGEPLATSTPMPSSGGQGATGQASVQQTSLQLADDEVQCVDIEAFNNYNRLQQEIKDVENSYKTLATNAQVKKLKFSFQKAVNTPINAISPVSGEHLRDKLQRLLALLQGHAVEISNRRTSVSEHPEALLFCKHLIARMIVKKGEEQVSSKHETAFAIAGVAVGVWCEHPDVGRFLIAEFHKVCPYIVPYHIPRQEGQSAEDYHKSLGYKFDDGKVEDQDKFLKRMSGVMRLYAALLVAVPPKGVNHPHPHGIKNAWIWLSRVMNIEPLPDITTTMVYDMLQVTGHALFKEYRKQFTKLLHILVKEYLPKLNHVATKAGSGPVSRLRTFLEDSIKNHGQIGPPEGLLPQNFWFS